MFTRFVVACVAVAFVGSGLGAEEIKGKITKIEEGKITLSVDGKETTYVVDKDVKVLGTTGKKNKLTDFPGGFMALKADQEVTLTTEKKEDKETVVKITAPIKKKKKKDK
jgi:ribosome maturation factor RimP